MIDIKTITDLHRETVARWHGLEAPDNPYEGFLELVCRQHTRNYLLWHEEDIARSPNVADAELARVKRNIDGYNQQRNDLIESLDACLIQGLQSQGITPAAGARLNTETPGSAIDRLSILSLRIFHMIEQTQREDADDEHCEKAGKRLATCYQQHEDLSTSLAELLEDIFAGRKCLKLYRQMKMYNDPKMNPWLYDPDRQKPAA